MAKVRTWEQPRVTILRRYRDSATTWAELECGHTEPATGLDLASAMRCQQCNPVMKPLELRPPADGRASGW